MRLAICSFYALVLLSALDASGQVLGYGAQGTDGYGTTGVTTRIARLPKDTAYHTLLPNELWTSKPWKDSVRSFADFQHGSLEHISGNVQKVKHKMNYNFFLDNIDVELETGEIVGMARYSDLKSVYIGDHKFRYEPALGFVEVIQRGTIELAKRNVMRSLLENSNGFKHYPYQYEDPRAARSSETRYYWPSESFWLMTPNGSYFRAGPLALHQIVPHLKDKLQTFARVNNIDFRKAEDLKKIVAYCNQHYKDPSLKVADDNWKDRTWLLPSFEAPMVVMEDGSKVELREKLNYNLVTGWMHTINKKGDTVLFATATRYLSATMEENFFFNDRSEGPMEVLVQGKFALARKPRIVSLGGDKYAFKDIYYLVVKNKAIEANERMVVALFPSYADEISEYILDNDVNFITKEEVLGLVAFCQQLQQKDNQ